MKNKLKKALVYRIFLEKDSDDFTSGDEEITDSFSSQIEEQVESNNDESNNDWTPLDNESKISF